MGFFALKTRVSRTRNFDKQLNKVPEFIRKKVMLWVLLIETQGITEVRRYRGYKDETLKGNRYGQRSVRLNKAYRLIYQELEGTVHILLLEVHKHDY